MKTTVDEIRETIVELCQGLREGKSLRADVVTNVAGAIEHLSVALINTVNADKLRGESVVEADINEEVLAKEEVIEDNQRSVEGYLVHWMDSSNTRHSQYRAKLEDAKSMVDTLSGFPYHNITISELHIGGTVWTGNGETPAANKDATEGNRSVIPSCRWDGKAWVWS